MGAFKLSKRVILDLRSRSCNVVVSFRCFVIVQTSGDGHLNFWRVKWKAWAIAELVELSGGRIATLTLEAVFLSCPYGLYFILLY